MASSIAVSRLPFPALAQVDSYFGRDPTQAPKALAATNRCSLSALMRSEPGLCRCCNPQSGQPSPEKDGGWKLDSLLQGIVAIAVKRFDDCVNSFRRLSGKGGGLLNNAGVVDKGERAQTVEEEEEKEVWDWNRWNRHFSEIEEQEWIASELKMQLKDAVAREDYEEAAKVKLALQAAAKTDTVGTAIYNYYKAVAEESYKDAAFLRDNAGTGLLGWWSGISKGSGDKCGWIIRISAEHGRYVARSYSSRQLVMSRPGSPLFEIYFTGGDEGYKQQAVYLKRDTGRNVDLSKKSTKSGSSLNENDSNEEPSNITSEDVKTFEEVDDSEIIDGLEGIKNILQDVIPGVKVKVLKVVTPGMVDKDLISKVIEQILEDKEGSDEDIHGSDEEDIKAESEIEEIEMIGGDEPSQTPEEQSDFSVNFIIGTLMEKMNADVPPKNLLRTPAELEITDRRSFSFYVKKEDLISEADARLTFQSKTLLPSSRSGARPDLTKIFISKEKMPIKVLEDIGELISLSMKKSQNYQSLSGTTVFDRIEISTTSDPLSGLYIGSHGMYSSEVLHLKRRFGQWQEGNSATKPMDLEFYEYVEAYKLTGALAMPAGQVVFRAKVGERNQLPHKGIIPDEFGVIARYKGQGRVADPGFQNPRWVDGELVILDGKIRFLVENKVEEPVVPSFSPYKLNDRSLAGDRWLPPALEIEKISLEEKKMEEEELAIERTEENKASRWQDKTNPPLVVLVAMIPRMLASTICVARFSAKVNQMRGVVSMGSSKERMEGR
ncbi:Protein executer 1, chloroplastic [Apostasia shenzhenica]|uniref:Protein executer 1, chloroplastic n=1 Tax=Apostasia shenzhenica TaxID=1088818 RepID=A0A2H9ZW11_9ASPA|nr:Protein executer 1, chloroplastic [Apostasia shenzhenica]